MQDPVKQGLDGQREDLYDVATWEVRSPLDRIAASLFQFSDGVGNPLATVGAWISANSPRINPAEHGSLVVNVAVVWLVAQFWLVLFALLQNLPLGVATALSAVPAVVLLQYVRKTDEALREPNSLLAVTFLGGVVLGFGALLINVALVPVFKLLLGAVFPPVSGLADQAVFDLVATAALALSFFLVVGPAEEALKWLAVRAYAYESSPFDTVVDGAVYGAVAGFGFATVENTIYIGLQTQGGVGIINPLGLWETIILTRAFLGPGHVIFAAFAGYYLGLAKFNPDAVGPIAVKGLLIAALLHGTYGIIGTYLITPDLPLSSFVFLAYLVVFNGIAGYVLYRKLSRYRNAYQRARGSGATEVAAGDD